MSLLTFSWMTSLIAKGEKKTLAMEDLWQLRETDTAKAIVDRFRKYRKPGRSLLVTLILVVIKPLGIQYCAAFLTPIFMYAGPFFLNIILTWFEDPNRSLVHGWSILLCMLFVNFASAMSAGQQYFHGRRVGLTVSASLITELYAKALRRPAGDAKPAEPKPAEEEEENSIGKIVTMMTVDVERIVSFVCYSHDPILNFPLSVILAFVGLYLVLGWTAMTGVAVIAINGPLTGYLGSFMEEFQDKQMKASDKRVAMTNEILNGIRIIKYFGWEDQFSERLLKVRETELGLVLKGSLLWIFTSLVTYFTSILCLFVTFGTYTIIAGHTLNAATAFTTVILLERVAELFNQGPYFYIWMIKTKVSLDRVEEFLNEVELDQFAQGAAEPTPQQVAALDEAISVGFSEAKFRYYNQDDSIKKPKKSSSKKAQDVEAPPPTAGEGETDFSVFTLQGIDICFRTGGLNVVTGATGAGKSSLILALLGAELKKLSGDINFPKTRKAGSVSYVAQTAWLLNATIRENITMGTPMDEERYRQTLEACALVRDLETLPGGDLTEIGEKGISLSGGQKQRISLARAVYSTSTIVLLDDPLSAVDAPTARHLMKNAIQKSMAGRTVILVTHAVGLAVRVADYLVVMGGGTIVAQGTPNEVASNPEAVHITASLVEPTESLNEERSGDEAKAVMAKEGDATKLVEDEEKEVGNVKWSVYMTYFIAAGFISSLISVILLVLSNILGVVSDAWIAKWTEDVRRNETLLQADYYVNRAAQELWYLPSATTLLSIPQAPASGSPVPSNAFASTYRWYHGADEQQTVAFWRNNHGTLYYVGIYGLIGLVQVINRALTNTVVTYAALRASRIIHERLLKSVLGAPLRFFETTPLGRILNRFTKDLSSVDGEVIMQMLNFAWMASRAATIVLVISFFSPLFVLALVPIGLVYRGITQLYLMSSRELKRLESVSVSPVISNFSETLHGASTVRAYGLSDKFMAKNEQKINIRNRCFYHLWASNRWLNLRTDLISAVFIFCAGVVVLSTDITPGWAGVTLLYATLFSDALLWLVRSHADMEMALNSVERCNEYSKLEQEPPRIVDDYRPGPNWPEHGEVEVKDLSIRYAADQPLVLKHLTFSTKKGERIGVVGRTGAGKSTLSLAFFRIIPHASGTIIIDGLDINKMGLHDLRSKLTIIPQDPVLFNGTIRSNLDPLSENSDDDLWRVLRETHVLESIQSQESLSRTPSAVNLAVTLASADNTTLNVPSDAASVHSSSASTTANGSFSLDSPVLENGSNYSQGQRQLLCLARALLRRSRVIFLDEATASIDSATDDRIQKTIKEELTDATIFCIAHRLRTVVDFDRILVLDRGEIVEFGTPLELITESKKAHFRKMCEDSGEMDLLLEMAKGAEVRRKLKESC
ncbi:P-loop containing nucleoside triphosphate hydrolase protein [Zopfochytrium polystomum]|nr:P-loop containing nucleoside triphosphate hydrolase protein [Zopfochytrium polystomum]